MKTKDTLQRMIARCPRFMHLEFDRIETLADLEYHCSVEINIAEGGGVEPSWTHAQMHRAKMYAAEVHERVELAKKEGTL